MLAVARGRFGLTDVDPERVAAWLRARYELRTRSMDLITDAYEYGNWPDREPPNGRRWNTDSGCSCTTPDSPTRVAPSQDH
ncbi:hypothetical protein, partial [Streptomyces hirsutus]|uniref:hypothetical protein n=1 Tax=Streptomyces hirsutus TaxID=35620 RepID=UPI00335E387F